MSEALKKIELTVFEKLLVNASKFGDLIVMGSSFIESLDSLENFDHNLVRNALTFMQKRHPFLRAHLEILEKENRIFLNLDTMNAEEKIRLEWLDLSSDENSREHAIKEAGNFVSSLFDYDNNDLLWRAQVIIYEEETKIKFMINLVMNLIITDGFNITTLSIELVNIINALLTGIECDEMRIRLEPVENLYVICKERKLFKESFREKIKYLNSLEKVKFNLSGFLGSSRETGFILDFLKLSKQLTSNIIAKSKINQLKLTGYFQTAALYAMKSLYDELDLEFPKRLSIELPASLRIRYQPNLEFYNCGHHNASVNFLTEEGEFGDFKDFWKDAKYIHYKIQENTNTETGSIFAMSHENSQIESLEKILSMTQNIEEAKHIFNNNVLFDLPVSNLGRYVNDKVPVFPGPFDIKEIYCTDSLNSYPKVTMAIIIHVFYWRGELMIEIGANKSSLGTTYFKKFKEHFLNILNCSLNESLLSLVK